MIKYLHMDCEMGGREIKYSLLTAYFLVTDEHFKKLGELFLEVKPDDGIYVISGGAMKVNNIDMVKHDAAAMSYKQAKPWLYNFLKEHANGDKLVPVGHGVRGDIDHVIERLISEGSWEQYCTYHFVDTSVVLQYLRACGKMPLDTDGSVLALCKYFKIIEFKNRGDSLHFTTSIWQDFDGQIVENDLHHPKADTIATMRVYKNFIEIGKK